MALHPFETEPGCGLADLRTTYKSSVPSTLWGTFPATEKTNEHPSRMCFCAHVRARKMRLLELRRNVHGYGWRRAGRTGKLAWLGPCSSPDFLKSSLPDCIQIVTISQISRGSWAAAYSDSMRLRMASPKEASALLRVPPWSSARRLIFWHHYCGSRCYCRHKDWALLAQPRRSRLLPWR